MVEHQAASRKRDVAPASLRSRAVVALASLLWAPAAACSSAPASAPAGVSTTSPPSSTPIQPSISAPGPSLTDPTPIELDCADAGTAGVPPPAQDVLAYGLTFTGVSASGRSLQADYELAVAEAMWHFHKVFLYASPAGPSAVRIHLEEPAAARIYWTGESGWTGSNREVEGRIVTGATDTVVVPSCSRTGAGFFGGVLAPAATCVRLTVTPVGDPAGEPLAVAVPVSDGVC